MSKLVKIIIIAHKPVITDTEIASLVQCCKILDKYSITIICPYGLNVACYTNVIPEIDIVFIDPKWQKTYKMFNDLKKSNLLLKMFKQYEYILYYELDAWVFEDKLIYWCNKGYDYIGAPWFDEWHLATENSKITGVGNGGFSLRKVSSSLKLLSQIRVLKFLRSIWYISFFLRVVKFEKYIFLFSFYFKIKNFTQLYNVLFNDGLNEDVFWTQKIGAVFSDFKVADIEDARKFSFEVNPSLLFKENLNMLPFGCHAWEKYEPEFWNDWILKSDNNL